MSSIVQSLSLATGFRPSSVSKIMATAPIRYKIFTIPKRNGERRTIAQPAFEVKLIQRALVDTLLRSLPIHPCAMGYRENLSIRHNAEAHAGRGPIIKMDLREFFPSIRAQDWTSYCRDTACLTDEEDIALTTSLLFHKPSGSKVLRLAIGAPSSPMLSNILMNEFDGMVQAAVSSDKVRYTRYADDLTFSAPRTGYLVGVVKAVAAVIRQLDYPKLDINGDKTTYITTKYHRSVTGLTLANDGRVTVGRDRKRVLHASVHRALHDSLPIGELQALSGMLAFVKSVEPSFLGALEAKYGVEVINRIQAAGSIRPERVPRHRRRP
jgi:RNA-directed DNA polymerase